MSSKELRPTDNLVANVAFFYSKTTFRDIGEIWLFRNRYFKRVDHNTMEVSFQFYRTFHNTVF